MTEAAVDDRPSLPQCPEHQQYFIAPGGVCPQCSWDPAALALVEEVQGEVVRVEQFEGSDVVEFEMKMPSTVVECDRSFKRGSVIRMAVEVQIRGVGYVEKKDGNLIRVHQASLEDISVISAFDPSQNHENVGGNLSGSAPDEPDDEDQPSALTGIQAGRTQDTWPPKE